ncbi:unnamed protein product [Paramecium primaurelia]|uniref:Uncharacterized protein n=1 Tax=Paramecium primaurelia TaxID=5886 RepID=A0A8S1PV14_PARPR|nr:unnamed protein product [Paramecium primaurelia]
MMKFIESNDNLEQIRSKQKDQNLSSLRGLVYMNTWGSKIRLNHLFLNQRKEFFHKNSRRLFIQGEIIKLMMNIIFQQSKINRESLYQQGIRHSFILLEQRKIKCIKQLINKTVILMKLMEWLQMIENIQSIEVKTIQYLNYQSYEYITMVFSHYDGTFQFRMISLYFIQNQKGKVFLQVLEHEVYNFENITDHQNFDIFFNFKQNSFISLEPFQCLILTTFNFSSMANGRKRHLHIQFFLDNNYQIIVIFKKESITILVKLQYRNKYNFEVKLFFEKYLLLLLNNLYDGVLLFRFQKWVDFSLLNLQSVQKNISYQKILFKITQQIFINQSVIKRQKTIKIKNALTLQILTKSMISYKIAILQNSNKIYIPSALFDDQVFQNVLLFFSCISSLNLKSKWINCES